METPPPGVRVKVPSEPVVIPSVPIFCLEGFDSHRTMTVVVTAPDGTEDTVPVPAYAHHYDGLFHPVPPGSVAGRYRVRAVQGSTTATAHFLAVRASTPHLWIYPRNAARGTAVDLYIGGFPPGRPADLYLYLCDPWAYRATLTVAIDARGEAHLALPTTATTKRTCYALNSPLVYAPSEPPETLGGPDNQVFWLHDPRPPEQPPNCRSAALRCAAERHGAVPESGLGAGRTSSSRSVEHPRLLRSARHGRPRAGWPSCWSLSSGSAWRGAISRQLLLGRGGSGNSTCSRPRIRMLH
jgi:hypothetical protein